MSGVYERSTGLPGVSDVQINLVWLPAWSPRLMTPAAKAHLGIED
jgi:metal-sulfur cluster biosynthetic enzyme